MLVGPVTRVTAAPRSIAAFAMAYPILPDELVMYEEAGVIINRLPDMEVIQYMDLADLPVLAAIPADASLAEFDLKGENVFYLSEEAAIVRGAREALKKIKILDEEGSA